MKKLTFLLICVLLFACENSNEELGVNTKKKIIYNFGEDASLSGTDNLIGVQIYKGVKVGNLTEYSPYAYGLFDDFSHIQPDLPIGADYKIVSSIVVNGKKLIAKDDLGYLKPFSIRDQGVALTNTFTYSTEVTMLLLNKCTTTLIDNKSATGKDCEVPPADRYYGVLTEYSGSSHTDPEIEMQRQVFIMALQVHFSGENIDPEECMYMTINGAPDTLFVYAKDQNRYKEAIYTFSSFEDEEESRDIGLKVYQRLPNGLERQMKSINERYVTRNNYAVLYLQMTRDTNGDEFGFLWGGS